MMKMKRKYAEKINILKRMKKEGGKGWKKKEEKKK